MGFYHRDIKADNMLVYKEPTQTKRGEFKLSDFGMTTDRRVARTYAGTPGAHRERGVRASHVLCVSSYAFVHLAQPGIFDSPHNDNDICAVFVLRLPCICTRVNTITYCIRAYIHVIHRFRMYVYACVFMYVCVYVCIYASSMYVCMYVCMYV